MATETRDIETLVSCRVTPGRTAKEFTASRNGDPQALYDLIGARIDDGSITGWCVMLDHMNVRVILGDER